MNNDFNQPKPNQTEDTPDTAPASEAAPFSQPQPVLPPQKPRRRRKRLALLLLILLLLAAAAGGVYVWQHSKLTTLQNQKDNLSSKVSTLSKQVADKSSKSTKSSTASTANTVSADIYNGQVDMVTASDVVSVTSLYKPGAISEIWLEYGSAASKLTSSTPHVTDGLGAVASGAFANQDWKVKKTEFTAGNTYFYRTVAKVNGKSVYSGTSSFTMAK